MLKTLRLKLTLLSALFTGIIVLAMGFFSFTLVKNQYILSNITASNSAIMDISVQWTQGKEIDFHWLSGKESQYNMLLYLEDNGNPLQFSQTNKHKMELAQTVKDHALLEYGVGIENIQIFDTKSSNAVFNLTDNNIEYRCTLQIINTVDGVYSLTAMQNLTSEKEYITNLGILCFIVAIIALLLNGFASFIVAGRAIKPAVKSAKEQEEFVLKIGHELRTPLAVLEIGFSAMELSPEDGIKYLPVMRTKTRQMGEIINEMLLIFSYKKPKWKVNKTPLEIDTFLLDYIEEQQPMAQENKLELNFDIQKNAFKTVYADKERLHQVLDVLLNNAYRYAPQNSKIMFSLTQTDKNTVLTLSDYGKGIKDVDKNKVFDKFYRVDGKDISGAHFGLGLSVAKEIITLHKGTITVQDNLPQGATFVISLPFN